MREKLAADTGLTISAPEDPFEAQGNRDALVELSGALKVVAVSLIKIAGDLALMGSGPRVGIGEIFLPELQKGSSIMPGKVNPVIPEVVLQVGAQVIGNDTAITIGGLQGQFELNVRIPLIARNLLQSIHLLSTTSRLFAEKCVDGIEPNLAGLEASAEGTLAVATALNPFIGYDRAAEIVKEASASGGTLREVARKHGVDEETLDKALDLRKIAAGSAPLPELDSSSATTTRCRAPRPASRRSARSRCSWGRARGRTTRGPRLGLEHDVHGRGRRGRALARQRELGQSRRRSSGCTRRRRRCSGGARGRAGGARGAADGARPLAPGARPSRRPASRCACSTPTTARCAAARAVQNVGFGAAGTAAGPRARPSATRPSTSDGLDFLRERMRRGLTVTVVAEGDARPGRRREHQPVEGVTEVVGVATLPAVRRQGLGGAVTGALVEDALARGVETVFLSAGSEDIARVYGRLGFRRIGTACIAG